MAEDQPQFEVTFSTLTYGGEAIGRLPDGRAVFVPFALPGEKALVRLTEQKRGFARGRLIEIVQSSPSRAEPRCKHFSRCGGCHYQHLSYADQLTAKQNILRDQLQRIGGIENPPVQECVPSPAEWRYRNHVQFHPAPGGLGYIDIDGQPFAIEECHLPDPAIDSLWRDLEFESESGVERVSIRSGAGDDLTVVLESEKPETPAVEIEAGVSIVHLYKDHPVVIAGQDHLVISILDQDFRVSAGSFFQVNSQMASGMVEFILSHLGDVSNSTVFDIYCGVGLFSRFIAPKCRQIIGLESSESACYDFAVNLDEFENVDLYIGAAEEILQGIQKPAGESIVLVDPPRSGIERHALDAILSLHPNRILYISCDPSTLARDAARLIQGGYRLLSATPFDLFPQTYHIESISIFEK